MPEPVDIFALWPNLNAMAAALGDKPDTVRKWRTAGRIPEDAWDRLIAAAMAIGKPVTVQQIYDFNAPMRRRGKGAESARRSRRRRLNPSARPISTAG